ncbi:ROK family transcriptional regulator [uncultured Cohaesibacter sp.]|uniref:ROK family transcriptional regulator n=1 Tax=uncultured Cohaesibacter sp. TaxID=1002546 RepID=UPI0029C9782B|nr:ROK family transcriptional regulator [uncultured Cohaesibacter sp.]
MARIDIANATGMSPATVTSITAELIATGLIEEVQRDADTSQSKRGRPRVDLKLRGEAHVVAGMKLTGRSISAVVLNLEGKQLGKAQVPMPRPPIDRAALCKIIPEVIEKVSASAGMKPEELSAVGIGLPGTIQATEGFVDWCPLFKDQEFNLKHLMEEILPMPVFVENDANSVAIAELWFGFGRDVPDFLVVTIEQGVGLGIVLNGQIFRGTQGFGAEFGHTKVQSEGALCRCGQRGCLEAYVADYALLREANLFKHWEDGTTEEEKLIQLFTASKAGDQMARSIFDRASRMFAMGLANLVNLFDPAMVILSGEQMQFDYLYAQHVFEMVRSSTIQKGHHEPEIRIHKWGDMMWAKGAAAYALEEIVRLEIDQMGNSETVA